MNYRISDNFLIKNFQTGLVFCLCFSVLFISYVYSETINYPDCYNVEWTAQSRNSSESMPLGGGDIGLNVWVENGQLLFYMSKSGTFDENNSFLKLGRVRLKTSPNLLDNPENFIQKLVLKDGNIKIRAQKGNDRIEIEIWVDVFRPVIHVEVDSNIKFVTELQYDSWRTEDSPVTPKQRSMCFSYTGYPGQVYTYKDNVSLKDHQIRWYHRNRDDKLLFDYAVKQQGLEEVKEQMWNPQKGLTFGGQIRGRNMVFSGNVQGRYANTDFTGWKLKSSDPVSNQKIKIFLHTDQVETLQQWTKGVEGLIADADKNSGKARQKTRKWWSDFWDRSYIVLKPNASDKDDRIWQSGRNYQLFRYMLGCNAYGDYPSKFNGSLFTFDPVYIYPDKKYSPDYRNWGGGSFTAQNQRLVYWPMLKSGDFDMMMPQFDYYRRPLKNAELRSKVYWNHSGCSFTEQLENFGLPFCGGWGWPDADQPARMRPADTEFGSQVNRWVRYLYTNQLEFSLMILDYYRYSEKDIQKYMPFIKSAVRFFDEHYQYRNKKLTGQPLDSAGKLVLYPSACCETYNISKNPSDLIAGLTTVLLRLQQLPETLVSARDKRYWQGMSRRIPPLPVKENDGHKVIAPAVTYGKKQNSEFPELYTVYPYGLYGVGKPDLQLALDTWNYGDSIANKKFTVCWSQIGIFAARLGLTQEASKLVVDKLADSARRFPTFWGPGPDYVPDVDHGGAGMINLQEMLMQTEGKKIYLLPAWPEDWDVSFKLHAPFKTVVEGQYKDGKFISLTVTPKARRNDVIFMES